MPRSIPLVALLAALLMPSCMCTNPQKQPAVRSATPPAETVLASADVDLPTHARGMWVWGVQKRLAEPDGTTTLLESCGAANVNEVYLSASPGLLLDPRLHALVAKLNEKKLRVEILGGEATWYQPGQRAPMLKLIDAVAAYNARHGGGIAAVHLDIEPHQLPENKVSHAFLPQLAEALHEARARAASHGLSLSADLPRFAFQEQGALFAESASRLFVMLYELRDRHAARLVATSRGVLDSAYTKLPLRSRGKVVVGLSVDDYPSELDAMLVALDRAHDQDARYGGWAIHDEARYRARFTMHDPAKGSPPQASLR